MDRPKCPLCQGEESQTRFSDKGYQVRQCGTCHLFFIDPYPKSADAQHTRVETYQYDDLQVADADKHYRAEVVYYGEHFAKVEEECRDAKAVLDVGCGTGRLLQLLGERHPQMDRAGIELNSARAGLARQKAGCEIHQAPIEEFSSKRKFDVILMMNVLSHIPTFDGLFRSVRGLLNPGGKFILKVGELQDDVQRGDLFDWGIPDHLHFLGLDTIDFAARQYGFRVARHDRAPTSRELFSRTRWKMPGRSALRDAVKQVVAHVPLALPALAKGHDWKHGRRVFSSLIVLVPAS
ncbi:MAG: class I SAM-dependent methyltransferase [Planctomycetota bacterium]|nr:class I SAM-dependent methyltransferase [Planctomycetota bacterium]